MPLLRRKRRNGDGTTVFFATDLHGSEVCFRKFVAAAAFYGADLLILGGDLTGKLVTPIVQNGQGCWSEVHGRRVTLKPDELDAFELQMADEGVYTRRMSSDEYAAFEAAPEKVDALFLELMTERLEHWIDLALEKLDGTTVRILTAPGNDDPYAVDDVIRRRGGDRVLLVEGEITEIAPGHEMLNTGWSNHTPWDTHREFDEEALRAHIEEMAGQLRDPAGVPQHGDAPPVGHLQRTRTGQALGGLQRAPVLPPEVLSRLQAWQQGGQGLQHRRVGGRIAARLP